MPVAMAYDRPSWYDHIILIYAYGYCNEVWSGFVLGCSPPLPCSCTTYPAVMLTEIPVHLAAVGQLMLGGGLRQAWASLGKRSLTWSWAWATGPIKRGCSSWRGRIRRPGPLGGTAGHLDTSRCKGVGDRDPWEAQLGTWTLVGAKELVTGTPGRHSWALGH